MLVLTRKSEQSIIVNRNIEIKILGISGDQVSLGFSAPDEISIYRKEIYEAMESQNRQSVHSGESALHSLRAVMAGKLLKNGKK